MTLHCVVCWCSIYFKCSFWSIWDLSSRIFLWAAITISVPNMIGIIKSIENPEIPVVNKKLIQHKKHKIASPPKKYNALFSFFICSWGSMFTGLTSMILGISILVPQDGHWVCCPLHSSWASRVWLHCGQLKVKFAMVVSWSCLLIVERWNQRPQKKRCIPDLYIPTCLPQHPSKYRPRNAPCKNTAQFFCSFDGSGVFSRW